MTQDSSRPEVSQAGTTFSAFFAASPQDAHEGHCSRLGRRCVVHIVADIQGAGSASSIEDFQQAFRVWLASLNIFDGNDSAKELPHLPAVERVIQLFPDTARKYVQFSRLRQTAQARTRE